MKPAYHRSSAGETSPDPPPNDIDIATATVMCDGTRIVTFDVHKALGPLGTAPGSRLAVFRQSPSGLCVTVFGRSDKPDEPAFSWTSRTSVAR